MKYSNHQIYKSLISIKENNADLLGLSFTYMDNGKIVCLIEGGDKMPVTNANKIEYIEAVIEYITNKSVKEQLVALKGGFYHVIDSKIVSTLSASNLQSIIHRDALIDLNDWKSYTVYKEPYNYEHPTIKLFWGMMSTFSEEQRKQVLQFSTATVAPPLEGFAKLCTQRGDKALFCIEHASTRLPKSFTCYNKLLLPEYKTIEDMTKMFIITIEYGRYGFDAID